MIKLKSILKEDDVTDKFGDVLFGSDHDLARFQGKSVEKNTKFETQLLDIMSRWLVGGWDDTEKFLWKNYPLLKKAAAVFPKVLKPKTPNGTEVYRGLAKLNPVLESQLMKTDVSDWIESGDNWMYLKPISYTPRQNVQSWTTSRFIAWGFSTEKGSNSGYLSTKQNDEFLFNQDFMSLLYSEISGKLTDESEILHFGKQYANDVYITVHAPLFRKIKAAYFKETET